MGFGPRLAGLVVGWGLLPAVAYPSKAGFLFRPYGLGEMERGRSLRPQPSITWGASITAFLIMTARPIKGIRLQAVRSASRWRLRGRGFLIPAASSMCFGMR